MPPLPRDFAKCVLFTRSPRAEPLLGDEPIRSPERQRENRVPHPSVELQERENLGDTHPRDTEPPCQRRARLRLRRIRAAPATGRRVRTSRGYDAGYAPRFFRRFLSRPRSITWVDRRRLFSSGLVASDGRATVHVVLAGAPRVITPPSDAMRTETGAARSRAACSWHGVTGPNGERIADILERLDVAIRRAYVAGAYGARPRNDHGVARQ